MIDFVGRTMVSAWDDLETCRGIGFSMGPVPWTAIVEWCRFHELDHDLAEMLIYVIRHVDNEEARARNAKRKRADAIGDRGGAAVEGGDEPRGARRRRR